MAYKVIYADDYLAHHGILGQKWGIRRFQNSDGTLTSAGRKRYGSGEKRDSNDEKESSSNSKSFSINSKYVKAAAIIGAAAIAGYATYKVAGVIKENGSSTESLTNSRMSKLSFKSLVYSTNKLDGDDSYNEYYNGLEFTKTYRKLSDIPKLKEDNRDTETKVEEMLVNGTINPFLKSCMDAGYDPLTMDWSSDDGYLNFSEKNGGDSAVYNKIAKSTSNCAMCTTSIIARLKGYDVSANETSIGCTFNKMSSWFKDASFEPCGESNDWNGTLNNISKQGNGAYGNMVISNGSMSHSVFYCVSNGKTRIYDGQLGFEWTSEKLKEFGFQSDFAGVMRVDNKEFSEEATIAFKKSGKKRYL